MIYGRGERERKMLTTVHNENMDDHQWLEVFSSYLFALYLPLFAPFVESKDA